MYMDLIFQVGSDISFISKFLDLFHRDTHMDWVEITFMLIENPPKNKLNKVKISIEKLPPVQDQPLAHQHLLLPWDLKCGPPASCSSLPQYKTNP